MSKQYDVIIIGSGPAGSTAAIYTSRANLNTLVVEGMEPGGQLTTTTEVENYPGFPDGIQGPELVELFKKQAEKFGSEYKFAEVNKVDFSVHPFKVWIEEQEHTATSVIIATGATARYLGLPSEQKYKGRGVSACATCDGFFYRDKKVAVIGGGDSAVEEAVFLTRFASKVYIIHRRDRLRASHVMAERAASNEKIEIIYNATVDEVLSETGDFVTGLRLKNTVTNDLFKLDVDGMFLGIGHKPNTEIFKDYIELDQKGYIKINDFVKTNVEGVFTAGDVADPHYQQAITAAGMGCKAALEAEEYISMVQLGIKRRV